MFFVAQGSLFSPAACNRIEEPQRSKTNAALQRPPSDFDVTLAPRSTGCRWSPLPANLGYPVGFAGSRGRLALRSKAGIIWLLTSQGLDL